MPTWSGLEDPVVVTPGLRRLQDEAAARRVHLDFCGGVERRDWDPVRSCYDPDAVDHHGPFSGDPEAFVDWASAFLDAVVSATHFIGNQIVDIDPDGTVAWHEADGRVYHRMRPPAAAARPTT
jgi:hypothetical protein